MNQLTLSHTVLNGRQASRGRDAAGLHDSRSALEIEPGKDARAAAMAASLGDGDIKKGDRKDL